MQSLFQFVSPPGPCGYLPDRLWSLEYDVVAEMNRKEYQGKLEAGWRRFGNMLFRPRCTACSACQSLRILVNRFRPGRSQKRAFKRNVGEIELRIGRPVVCQESLSLYDRYHEYQSMNKGWPEHPAKDAPSYRSSFIDGPIPAEEWLYYLKGQLVGVGYVDSVPQGLSAVYFFYEPEQRQRSLGTWNVLNLIGEARKRGLPFLYLGYYVADCPSLAYKAGFVPNQVLRTDGQWNDFRP